MSPRVSIILTTRNRAAALAATLASFRGLDIPPVLPTELLLVDNGSLDDTPAVCRGFRLPQLTVRCLHAPLPGQARARNRALAAACGDVLLFTDDDVRVPPDWLTAMANSVLSPGADADIVAGGVALAASLQRPWMTPLHRAWLASTERLDPLAPAHVVGANMAFARRVLDRVPGFDPHLGPGALGFADETLFCHQVVAAGYRLGGALTVQVEHHPDPRRLERPAWLATARQKGASAAYADYHWFRKSPGQLLGRQLRALARLGYARARNPGWRNTPGCPAVELSLVAAASYWRQLRQESARPHESDAHENELTRSNDGTKEKGQTLGRSAA